MEGLHLFKNINMFKPLAFKIKGDFGTVYITKGGIKDVAPEGVLYVSNIHPDDDIIDRDSLKYDIILKHLYDILEHRYKSDGNINNIDITNTLGHKSLLKEIYTKTFISADERGMKFRSLEMLRTRINSVEYSNRFFHPHSPSIPSSRIEWSCMCLGDSVLYNHFFKRKRKITDMSLYSVYLDAYLAWESREGGPYITIENVYNCSDNQANSNVNIDNIDIDDIIYKHADIFQVVDYRGKLFVSSDFMNDIKIEGVHKTNSYNNYFDINLLRKFDNLPDIIESNVIEFKGMPLKLVIEDIDKEELKLYMPTIYNMPPKELMGMIKNRVSSIINLNYEKNNREEVRNTGVTEER
jgi:hypothetical protein